MVLFAVTWVSLRGTDPEVVVDPLTGHDSIPTPRWLAPGIGWPGKSVVPCDCRVLLLGHHHDQEVFCDPYFIHVRPYRLRPCGPPR